MKKTISLLTLLTLLLTACQPKYFIVTERGEDGSILAVTELSEQEKSATMRIHKATLNYDTIPNFRLATLKKPAENYDPEDYNTFAVYTHPHTVAPLQSPQGTDNLAIWCTKEATYLAIVDEQMWTSRYHQTSKEVHLRDSQTGKTYPIIKLLGYPLEQVFWIEGIPGEWRCRVLVFPPLPKQCTTIDFINDGPKPKHVKGTTGWGIRKSLYKIPVSTLQAQQHIATFKETVVVE